MSFTMFLRVKICFDAKYPPSKKSFLKTVLDFLIALVYDDGVY